MRTLKTLLCLSALAAGIATSVAQNVYSLNIVGYVNVQMQAGNYHYVNPLDKDGTNNAGAVLTLPDATYFAFWTGSAFDSWYYEAGFGDNGWCVDASYAPKPAPNIPPGKGFYVNPPYTFTNTFVGNVWPNPVTTTNSMPVLAGNQLIGSQLPVGGYLTNALFNWAASVPDGSYISIWTGGAFDKWYYEPGSGMGNDGWYVDAGYAFKVPPQLDVGRSLYVNAPFDWTWKQTLP